MWTLQLTWKLLIAHLQLDGLYQPNARLAARMVTHRMATCLPSQAGLHEVWGGVKPDVARDAHARAIGETVDSCLQEAGVHPQDLTAVAVTVGPGLALCLLVGAPSGPCSGTCACGVLQASRFRKGPARLARLLQPFLYILCRLNSTSTLTLFRQLSSFPWHQQLSEVQQQQPWLKEQNLFLFCRP